MVRARAALPFLAALAVVVVAVGLLGYSASLNPIDVLLRRGPMVSVPDVVGRTRPRAQSDLEAVGLRTRFTETFSLTTPRGAVARLLPVAGAKLRAGSTVTVAISKGVNSAVMPAAVGRRVAEVVRPLRRAGITVRVRRVWSPAPRGRVVAQDPEPGTVVRGRDVVTLRVSRGLRPSVVPNVAGLSLAGAGFRLGSAGLTVGSQTLVDNSLVPAGAVVGTTPAAGSTVARNAPVELLISVGPPSIPAPDFVRSPALAAADAARRAGFVVTISSVPVAAGSADADVVISQTPAAGAQIRPGQLLALVVGRVPTPIVTTTTTSTTSTTAPIAPSTTRTVEGPRG